MAKRKNDSPEQMASIPLEQEADLRVSENCRKLAIGEQKSYLEVRGTAGRLRAK